VGSAGNDIIDGKGGTDALTGGAGADTFLFSSPATGADFIADFSLAEGDKIGLDEGVFGSSVPNFTDISTGGSVTDASPWLVYYSDFGLLFYDADGNGAGSASLLANINGNPLLTAGDFTIIA
jgi:Ca2+-binding RTX toxin-like protein